MSHHHHEIATSARSSDAGMTTAEYAVGTIGATSIALVLLRLAGDSTLLELVRPFFQIGLTGFPWPDELPIVRPFRGILR